MRNYLKNINIIGSVLCYQEEEQCKMTIDWLYENCDKVLITLDNWNKETEKIIKEYKDKYPDRTYIAYCDEPIDIKKNNIPGHIKRRFKLRQAEIREFVIKKLKEIDKEWKIDLLIWPDSDEIFINEMPKILEEFWNRGETYMMCGFIDVWDNFKQIMQSKMSPHGRIFKFDKNITVYPWKGRTIYNPYFVTRAWKVRNIIIHMCYLKKEWRERRWFFNNGHIGEFENRNLWILPKDVREMTKEQIADYQPGSRNIESKYKSILLKNYLNKNYEN